MISNDSIIIEFNGYSIVLWILLTKDLGAVRVLFQHFYPVEACALGLCFDDDFYSQIWGFIEVKLLA